MLLQLIAVEEASLSINLNNSSYYIPYDILLALICIIVFTLISLKSKGYVISMIFSYYPAILIFKYINIDWFSFLRLSETANNIIIFVILFALISFLFKNAICDYVRDSGDVVFYEAILLGCAVTILVFITLYHITPIGQYSFSIIFDYLFSYKEYIALQLSMPIIFVYLATR